MANYRKIPKLPGGAMGYVVKQAQDAERRAAGGLRQVNPATMSPAMKRLLKLLK